MGSGKFSFLIAISGSGVVPPIMNQCGRFICGSVVYRGMSSSPIMPNSVRRML